MIVMGIVSGIACSLFQVCFQVPNIVQGVYRHVDTFINYILNSVDSTPISIGYLRPEIQSVKER